MGGVRESGEKAGLNSYSNGNIAICKTISFFTFNLILSFRIYYNEPRSAERQEREPGLGGDLLALFSELAGIGGEAPPPSLSVFIA